MGLLELLQQGIDQITGEAQRKAEAERQKAADLVRIEGERQKAAAEKPLEQPKSLTIDREILAVERQQQPGPAERLMPRTAEQIREAAKPQPEKSEPEKTQEATRMENTRDFQPPPVIVGPGMGPFSNSRAYSRPPAVGKGQERQQVDEVAAKREETHYRAIDARNVAKETAMRPPVEKGFDVDARRQGNPPAKQEGRSEGIQRRFQENVTQASEFERQRVAKMSPQERQADKRQTDERWLQKGLQQLERESRIRTERIAAVGEGRERSVGGKDPRYR